MLYDPKHFRERANELRVIAAQFESSYSKEQILRIADDYDRLAERAEQRAKEKDRGKDIAS